MPVPFVTDEQIESRAEAILRTHGLTQAPIDPVVVAKNLGIQVFSADFNDDDDTCGSIEMPPDGPARLYFNRRHPTTRQRFTVAHEIGHGMFHRDHGQFVDSELNLFRVGDDSSATPEKRRMEIQANKFAAALLMPRSLVSEARKVTKDIRRLAELFGVSREAMGFRLASLDTAE